MVVLVRAQATCPAALCNITEGGSSKNENSKKEERSPSERLRSKVALFRSTCQRTPTPNTKGRNNGHPIIQ